MSSVEFHRAATRHLQVLVSITNVSGNRIRRLVNGRHEVTLMNDDRLRQLILIEGSQLSVVDQCLDVRTGVEFAMREECFVVQLNIVG